MFKFTSLICTLITVSPFVQIVSLFLLKKTCFQLVYWPSLPSLTCFPEVPWGIAYDKSTTFIFCPVFACFSSFILPLLLLYCLLFCKFLYFHFTWSFPLMFLSFLLIFYVFNSNIFHSLWESKTTSACWFRPILLFPNPCHVCQTLCTYYYEAILLISEPLFSHQGTFFAFCLGFSCFTCVSLFQQLTYVMVIQIQLIIIMPYKYR